MYESDSIISKSDYEDYKINISDVFKPTKISLRDSYLPKTKTSIENNNQNYKSSNVSNTFSYLYTDRIANQSLSTVNISNRSSANQLRKKSYNLQKQRTIKKSILYDPFWGIFPEKKQLNKSYSETKPINETFVVQKIIEKIEKQTSEPSSNQSTLTTLAEKKSARLDKIEDESTNVFFNKIEKEKTSFSIKLAYDDLFDRTNNQTSLTNRDINASPHTYMRLNSAPSSNKEKLIEIDDRTSLNPTPDNYHILENPGPISIYSELDITSDKFHNRNKKFFSNLARKKSKNPYETTSNNMEILNQIEPAAYNLDTKDNIYQVDKLAQTVDSNLNTESFILKKINVKKSFQNLPNTRRLNSIRTFNVKGFSKLSKSVKEFKNCIITDVKIGEGEFSETFQGYRYDEGIPSKIAAKRLKKLKEKGDNIVNLISEITVLTQLGSHPNIIQYFGINTFEDSIYMIFEYAEKGDLKKQLEFSRKTLKADNSGCYLNKIKLAYEIANGMEYISGLDIVHKDLAARNILLDKDFNAKIADFGCCNVNSMPKRPIRWMAPESITKLLFTTASDVWSFAVVLWEIWTYGMTPYPGMTDDEVMNRVSRWYRLYKPNECPDEIYNLMQSCWKEYSKARPRFPFIKKKLKELYENKTE